MGGAILGLSRRAALTTALSRPLRRQGTERGSRGAASRRARERDRCESRVLSSAYLRRTATATATAADVGRALLLSRLSEPEARPVLQEAGGDGGCIDLRPYLIRDGAHGPARLRTRKYCEFHERLRAALLANQGIRSLLRSFPMCCPLCSPLGGARAPAQSNPRPDAASASMIPSATWAVASAGFIVQSIAFAVRHRPLQEGGSAWRTSTLGSLAPHPQLQSLYRSPCRWYPVRVAQASVACPPKCSFS